jgi:hypothetical protein
MPKYSPHFSPPHAVKVQGWAEKPDVKQPKKGKPLFETTFYAPHIKPSTIGFNWHGCFYNGQRMVLRN